MSRSLIKVVYVGCRYTEWDCLTSPDCHFTLVLRVWSPSLSLGSLEVLLKSREFGGPPPAPSARPRTQSPIRWSQYSAAATKPAVVLFFELLVTHWRSVVISWRYVVTRWRSVVTSWRSVVTHENSVETVLHLHYHLGVKIFRFKFNI